MSKSRFANLSLASFVVLILFAVGGYAQSGGSTVRGTVKDPNGNVVSGASVTLTDPERNFTRTQPTNEDGAYVFTAIPPGSSASSPDVVCMSRTTSGMDSSASAGGLMIR